MKLVTGGAGFIGANVVAALNAAGEHPLVVDRFRHGGKWRNLAGATVGNIVPPERLADTLAAAGDEIEAVIHMGAVSSTVETDGDLTVGTNFALSRQLWQWCARHHRPFVYASSAAVYGDGSQGFHDAEDPAYLARLRPLNLYGWSKLLFDRWAVSQPPALSPPRWMGLRFFNVYGPGEAHKASQRSVVSQCLERARAGEPLRLFASSHAGHPDGGQQRDFVWVGDCVRAVLGFLADDRPGGILNLGTGEARSFNELARGVLDALGGAGSIEYVPMSATLAPTYQSFTQAEMAKFRASAGSWASVGLEHGIRLYAAALNQAGFAEPVGLGAGEAPVTAP